MPHSETSPDFPDSVLIYRTVGQRELRLFAFLPTDRSPALTRPGVLIIHGGGWRSGSADVEFSHARALADAGLAAYCLEYRLAVSTAEEVRECVRDARVAIRYLREHAAEFSLAQIAVAGSSAGGHLALGSVLFDEAADTHLFSAAADALILRYAVVDTSPDGYGYDLLGAEWESLSPLHRLRTGLSPTLMFHGTADTLTPYAGAVAFHARMRELGNACELITADGAPHTHLRIDPDLARDAILREIAFLRSFGWSF